MCSSLPFCKLAGDMNTNPIERISSSLEKRSAIMKSPSLLGWYRILRVQYEWNMFQAIRFALWLAR
jgi:hypothetical protein